MRSVACPRSADGEQKIDRLDAVFFDNPINFIVESQIQACETGSKIDSRIAVAVGAGSR